MPTPPPNPLVEGRDYHVENGRWVFTAAFLLERGYCCESRCRHCPYGFTKSKHGDGRAAGDEPKGAEEGSDSNS